MINYREEYDVTKNAKIEYHNGILNLIEELKKSAKTKREAYFSDIFTDQEKYRTDFRRILGWPLTMEKPSELPRITEELIADEETHLIYRMSFEILDGVKMSGLFFKAKTDEKKPLVIVQHGGLGTPELISNFYDNTANYNHMTERVIGFGVHAFAPQLLIWNQEDFKVPFSRADIDNQLKHLGSSITAVEIYGLSRILDYFEAQVYVGRFGMVGLSYGGFYTLFAAAADSRIESSVSCAFFNTRDRYPWSDWTWFGCADKFDDAEIACLVYPRRICLEVADHDELFDQKCAEESFARIEKYCAGKNIDCDWCDLIVFDGNHEFCKDDAPLERMIRDIM